MSIVDELANEALRGLNEAQLRAIKQGREQVVVRGNQLVRIGSDRQIVVIADLVPRAKAGTKRVVTVRQRESN